MIKSVFDLVDQILDEVLDLLFFIVLEWVDWLISDYDDFNE